MQAPLMWLGCERSAASGGIKKARAGPPVSTTGKGRNGKSFGLDGLGLRQVQGLSALKLGQESVESWF
jgi:hypothetical protein